MDDEERRVRKAAASRARRQDPEVRAREAAAKRARRQADLEAVRAREAAAKRARRQADPMMVRANDAAAKRTQREVDLEAMIASGASPKLFIIHPWIRCHIFITEIEALPEVVAAVGDRMEIYMDGGVRSGADAVKAVSIGARAVFIGRPVLWGLAYNGKKGVDKVLDIFGSEFNRTIQLLGVPDASKLCTDFVVRETTYSQPLHRNCAPRQPWGDWVPYKITK